MASSFWTTTSLDADGIAYRSRPAFSLVELLTVIAVISVLSLLVVVGLNVVKENANQTKCAANLRQIYVACNLYSNEHSMKLIPANTLNALNDGDYLSKNSPVWICPTDEAPVLGPDEDRLFTDISYARNGELTGFPRVNEGTGYWVQSKASILQIPEPEKIAFWADASTYWMNQAPANRNVVFRHGGHANVIFLDGHIDSVAESEANDFYLNHMKYE